MDTIDKTAAAPQSDEQELIQPTDEELGLLVRKIMANFSAAAASDESFSNPCRPRTGPSFCVAGIRSRSEGGRGVRHPELESQLAARPGTALTPDLHAEHKSFAARLILYVRDRFNGNAPAVYNAAQISRKTYSAIISNELRPVAKSTALALALALRLSEAEMLEFIGAAGYTLSTAISADVIWSYCFRHQLYQLKLVYDLIDHYLAKSGAQRPTPPPSS